MNGKIHNIFGEILRDVRALGSWVFFMLFVVRVWILPDEWPFFNQLLIAGLLVLVVQVLMMFFVKKVKIDYYLALASVLAWFSTRFYDDYRFTWLVGVVFLLVIYGGWYENRNWKKIGLGLVLGVGTVFSSGVVGYV